MPSFLKYLNVIGECREAHLSLWSCPPFLFVVLGVINIAAMLGSWLLASRYVEEPEVAALVVMSVSVLIFVVGNFIIHGFNQIAQANRLKSEFIAIVSHQLRSPLSIFKWTLDAMSRAAAGYRVEAREGPNHGEGHLAILRENAEKMIQLVNMLLEVSRIEAGRLVLRRDPVRLELLTEEIIQSYAPYARASNITLEYVSPKDLPPVRGDREKLKMVVQNLVDNAIRYSHGGGHVAVSIAPTAEGRVAWKIRDTGVGIPKPQQRFVFQKFFRADHAVKHETNGSGLGLYIAHSVVNALGGKIGFESEEAKGSTFWFYLPTDSAGGRTSPVEEFLPVAP